MGDVYRARDSELRREVALKVLPPSLAGDLDRLARFHREARVLAALNHPHIAAIYGLERSASTPALVLELVDGPTLAARIARGPLPLREALTIATQIADAVQAAHEKGIIHRDLKPSNVSLTVGGSAKVLDFGIAKLRDEGSPVPAAELLTATSDSLTTAAGRVFGTLAYMSPEQALRQHVDERTDIWAFGCILFEMLVGRRAFEGRDTSETLNRIVAHEPAWAALPRGVPKDLRALLAVCLEKTPDRRLSRIVDAYQTLKNCSARLDNIHPLAARMSFSVARPRRVIAVMVAGVALIAALVGILARFSNGSVDSSAPQSRTIAGEASQTELIAVLERRAVRILARFDKMIAEEREADSNSGRLNLPSARALFVELHQKHIAALRANQLVLAEELSSEIYHLLFLLEQFSAESLKFRAAIELREKVFSRGSSPGNASSVIRPPDRERDDSLTAVILDYPASAGTDLKVDPAVLERLQQKLRSLVR
jgi:serine/threonine protein kinase